MNKQATQNTPAQINAPQPPANVIPGQNIGILPEELRLPIIGLIQDKNHLLEQSDQYEIGQFVDFSTGEVVSKKDESNNDFLHFIPIHVKRVYVCKNPRSRDSKMFDKTLEPNELIFKTENPADPRIQDEEQLAEDREADPRVKKYLQYLCYVDGYDMPVIISFGKSSRVPGEQLLTKISFAARRGIHSWQRKYKLTSVPASYKEFNFYKLNFEKINDPTDEELSVVKDWSETIATQNYEPETENFDEGEETPHTKKESAPAQSQAATDAPY